MHTNAKTRQSGQGLTSFIVGLLIATLIIAGILYFLNNSKSDFKNPTVNRNQPSAPEILTPATSSMPELPSPVIPPRQPASAPDQAASQPAASDVVVVQQDNNNPNTPNITPKPNPVNPPEPPKVPVTPAQILESGSIEKAQNLVNKPKTKKNRVYLQIGSFNNLPEADTQRAKLVMLGIDSNISSVNINGTTRYRVVTNSMNQNDAIRIQETLKQNNFDSLTKSAP